jgi:hypothetical protein
MTYFQSVGYMDTFLKVNSYEWFNLYQTLAWQEQLGRVHLS